MAGCKICKHPDREQIEFLIGLGQSVRKIAAPYDFSYKTVERHKNNCMKAQEEEAQEEPAPEAQVIPGTGTEEVDNAITVHIEDQNASPISAKEIVQAMDGVRQKADRLFEAALKGGEYGACIQAMQTEIASQALIVDMAKIAAFSQELPKNHRKDDEEEEEDMPGWLFDDEDMDLGRFEE